MPILGKRHSLVLGWFSLLLVFGKSTDIDNRQEKIGTGTFAVRKTRRGFLGIECG